MAKKKKKIQPGLGKGLGALLPSLEFYKDKGFKVVLEDEEETRGKFAIIDVLKIHHNPYQPRKDFDEKALEDLKKSIQQHGMIQPITVRREINGYELIAGERRLRASIRAGLEKIPVFVLDIDHGYEILEIALIENLLREDLNPIEEANGYQRLIEECGLTQDQVAAKVQKDRSTVANFLRLLRLPEKIQESLRNKRLSMGHARALLGLSSKKKMMLVWEELLESELSVRATEKLVKDIESGKIQLDKADKKLKKKFTKPQFIDEISIILEDTEDQLRHIFGTQVRIKTRSEESGSIELEFYSKDELDRLLELFYIIEKNML